jgi:hypothetical protein
MPMVRESGPYKTDSGLTEVSRNPMEFKMRPLAFSLCICLCASQAFAQASSLVPTETAAPAPMHPVVLAPRSEIRVTSTFNISEPVTAADKSSLTALEGAARKTIYEIAGSECKLLLETIARECQIESLHVNSNLQSQNFRDPSTPLLNTSSNAVFRIVPKD